MSAPLFTVANRHPFPLPAGGTFDGEDGAYRGYFANAEGEQAVYLYDGMTKVAMLFLGDAGWAAFRVLDGTVPVILDEAEATWLRACWLATGGRP